MSLCASARCPRGPGWGRLHGAWPAVPWPCANAKLVVGLKGLISDVPGILAFKWPVQLGKVVLLLFVCVVMRRVGRRKPPSGQGSVPHAPPFVFGIGDRFATVIPWSVMYGFLFALNAGVMCSTVISLDWVLLCLKKKKPRKFQKANV